MVKVVADKGKRAYVCEVCHYAYEEEDLARQCQQWCEERHM